MTPTDHRPHMTLTQRLVQNWIGLAGVVGVGASFFAFALLMAIDLSLGFDNPYLGLFTYLVAPFFLVLGLLLMAAGVLVEHLRRLRHAAEEAPRFPRLDFNSPRQRKAFGLAAGATGVFLLATAFGSYGSYHFSESVSFCGKTCHNVMAPE